MRVYMKVVVFLAMLATIPVCRAEEHKEHLSTNHTITLVMAEGEENKEFSHTFAGKLFEAVFAEGFIRLEGELQPSDNGQILFSYELRIKDSFEEEGERRFVESGCGGQLLLTSNVEVAVLSEPDRSFALLLGNPEKTQREVM